jgi:membrane fusion protein (multidrug efflux system)
MPGFFARIKLNVQTHDKAVMVPAEAVLVNAKGDRVAFIVQEGKAIARKVTTGIESGRLIEIVSGVKPGEQVVVAGNEKLKDQTAIKLLDKKSGPNVKADAAKPATSSTKGTPK